MMPEGKPWLQKRHIESDESIDEPKLEFERSQTQTDIHACMNCYYDNSNFTAIKNVT